MQLLNNQMTKLVLLVVVVAVLLFALNVNYKKIGKEVALLGTLAVFLLAGYLGHTIMNEPDVSNNVPVSANNVPVYSNNNVPVASNNNAVLAANNNNAVLASNNELIEGFQNNEEEAEPAAEPGVADYDPSGSSQNAVEQNGSSVRDTLSPEDLLPGSLAPNNWDTPANPGGLDGPNFLNPEHLVGINTVGQSLRNANRQLRSEPPNPQVKVSPWLQTTIEPDTNRRPMEIGGGCE
jgi:hypothetical protein